MKVTFNGTIGCLIGSIDTQDIENNPKIYIYKLLQASSYLPYIIKVTFNSTIRCLIGCIDTQDIENNPETYIFSWYFNNIIIYTDFCLVIYGYLYPYQITDASGHLATTNLGPCYIEHHWENI